MGSRSARLLAVALTAAALVAVPSPSAAAERTPFDSPTRFCETHSAPPGKRTSSGVGITDRSITIADSGVNSDFVRRLGVIIPNYHQMWKAWVDEINACGGINGRRLILKDGRTNPAAVDANGHYQATCLKITEDQKAAISIGSFGAGVLMTRCIGVLHQTILDAPAYATSDDFRDSKGRIISRSPAGDRLATAFIADGVRSSTFKDKRVTVLASATTPLVSRAVQQQYVDELRKRGVDDVELEVLPCTGNVCTQGVGNAVRRMKSNRTNLIVVSHYMPVSNMGVLFREMRAQGLRAPLTGPTNGSLMSDTVLPQTIAAAGADGAAYAAEIGWTGVGAELYGDWRIGKFKETPFGKMCQATLAKRTGSRQFQYVEADIVSSNWSAAASSCTEMRVIARAIWRLGNNVTTARLAAALADEKVVERWDTGPWDRENFFWAGRNVTPTKVITLKFHFPCPLPRLEPTRGCFMPQNRPPAYRTVRL